MSPPAARQLLLTYAYTVLGFSRGIIPRVVGANCLKTDTWTLKTLIIGCTQLNCPQTANS